MDYSETFKDMEFRDGGDEDDTGNEGKTIDEIILRQIKKIGDICSKELCAGYWTKKPISVGGGISFSQEYHEDGREAYCNSVEFIIDLVYPIADTEFKGKVDELEKETNLTHPDKLNKYKKMFREINKMFDRTEYFDNSIDVTAKSK